MIAGVMSVARLLLLAARLQVGPEAPAEVELSWEAPESCPDAVVVLERVQGSLGRPLVGVDEPVVRVEATVAGASTGGLELLLRTETGEGVSERRMSGQTCDVLVDAAALVIAMALDPSLGLGSDPEPEPKSEPPPPCVEPTPDDAKARRPPDPELTTTPELSDPGPPEVPLAGTARFAAMGSLGPLPAIAPGFEVVAGLIRRQVRLELGFGYAFAREIEQADGAGAEIQLWTVGARGCWAPSVAILELPVCGGMQLGPMRGEGRGAQPATTRLAWVAAEAGGAVVVRGLPLVDVWLGADLVVPLTRPGFSFEDQGLVHRSAVVGGEAAIGLEVRFGPGRDR